MVGICDEDGKSARLSGQQNRVQGNKDPRFRAETGGLTAVNRRVHAASVHLAAENRVPAAAV
jgi:hypothetical protein